MRILLAAPQDKTVLGVIAGDCRNALIELGNEVEVFDFRRRPYALGVFGGQIKRCIRKLLPVLPSPYDISPGFREKTDNETNRRLEILAGKFQPDLLLVFCGENILPTTLEKIRAKNHPVIVNWFHDTLLLPNRQEFLQRIGAAYDIFFIIDSAEALKKVKLPLKKVEVLPLGFNPAVHKKISLTEAEKKIYASDVAFVGTVTPQREKWLEELAEFDLKIWGRWPRKSRLLARFYQKKDVYAEEAVKVYNAAKIIVDFHSLWQKEEPVYNVTPRVFEVPASGGFLLTNPSVQIGELYKPGEEIAVYRDIEELKSLIRYYLKNEVERLAMAEKAHQKACSFHALPDRLKQLLEIVKSSGLPRNKTNILYLHETSRISGAENSLLNLVKNLDRAKFNPFFVLPENGPLEDELKALSVEVKLIPFPRIRNFFGVSRTLKAIISLIREKDIRIVHSNSIRTHIYGALAAKRCGIASVWHQRNLLRGEIVDPDRLFSFLADKIICNSAAIARRFETFGRLPGNVREVFNGVDADLFNPSAAGNTLRSEFKISPEKIVVGISSRFNIQKGHETFLKAGRIIVSGQNKLKDRIIFLVAGGAVFEEDKNRERYLKDMAGDLGIKDKIIFTGFRRDMPRVYAAMDIFVLASDAEACGRVVLEAMASGKPIVATGTGGTPEIISDGENGILFNFNDSRDLADKIVYLVENPGSAKMIAENARKTIERGFTIQEHVRKIELIYEELLRE